MCRGFIWVALEDKFDGNPPVEVDDVKIVHAEADLGEGPYWLVGASFGRTE